MQEAKTKKIEVLDKGYVELVDSWGSDERIIESARMSTGKGFQGWDKWNCDCGYSTESPEGYKHFCIDCGKEMEFKAGDEKLLRYLWTNKHTSPFEMCGLTVEMKLPIFVAREIIRHRTFSFNEFSARYAELPDEVYIPSVDRLQSGKQGKKNKQGSEEGFSEHDAIILQDQIKLASASSMKSYKLLLQQGLSRELARVVVPVNVYTRWRMQGVLLNWLKFLALRIPENVQMETRLYAWAVSQFVQRSFPRTWTLFNESLGEKKI